MGRMRKAPEREHQLSLFEEPAIETAMVQEAPAPASTVLDFVRARFEHGPDMTPEEYRRWIKILIHSSLKRLGE